MSKKPALVPVSPELSSVLDHLKTSMDSWASVLIKLESQKQKIVANYDSLKRNEMDVISNYLLKHDIKPEEIYSVNFLGDKIEVTFKPDVSEQVPLEEPEKNL